MKMKKKNNPTIIAALIIVCGFFLYKIITYSHCMVMYKDFDLCGLITF